MENLDIKEKRNDIYLYRFIAVLLVILFHLKIRFFDFGFFGVDLFFVISGYLITSSILRDQDKGDYSVKKFYTKRIRRIIPPLFGMMLLFTPILTIFYSFDETLLTEIGATLKRIAFYIQNIFFDQTSGYFSLSSKLRPFIHTWSLAIEEQFYLLYPLLFLLPKPRKAILALIVASIILTFALDIKGVSYHYFLSTRIWQLGLGCFFAFLPTKKVESAKKLILMMISYLILLLITQEFLADTIGETIIHFIILASFAYFLQYQINIPKGPNKLFILGGKSSYSLYLFHWPIIVIIYMTFPEWGALQMGVSFVLTLILSFISLKLLEENSFFKTMTFNKALVTLALFSGLVFTTGYLITPKSSAKNTENKYKSFEKCKDNNIGLCREYADQGNDRSGTLIIGDSQISSIETLMLKKQEQQKFNIFLVPDACRFPLELLDKSHYLCQQTNNEIEKLLERNRISRVVVTTLWQDYFNSEYDYQELTRKIDRYITNLHNSNVEVIFLDQIPASSTELPKLLAQEKSTHFIWSDENSDKLSSFHSFVSEHPFINFISYEGFFCYAEKCSIYDNGKLIYQDAYHLNKEGKRKLQQFLWNKL
ncbi:MAG: acyltransferase [Oligoflexia bacterium]|nr:acyltransferase [Oligoflexia bacterium]